MNQIVTTYRNGGATIKPFAWSYSRLKNFESCPKRHYHIDILKDHKEEESESLLWGNALHSAAAKHLSKGEPLPPGMDMLKPWCEKIVGDGSAKILVEQRLAITKDHSPCEWFAKNAWFRSVADVIKIAGPVALTIDWKTGKILEDSVQLSLMAACIFAHHPEVQRIRTEFVWLAHDASSRADFSRDGMAATWRNVWPRIEALEHAHNTTTYPAKPGGLCRSWCVVSSCPHHGGE